MTVKIEVDIRIRHLKARILSSIFLITDNSKEAFKCSNQSFDSDLES